MKHQAFRTIQAKPKLAFTFFSPFGRDRLWRNPRKSVASWDGNFEVLKCCYIQIYPTSFSFFFFFFFAVLWKSRYDPVNLQLL